MTDVVPPSIVFLAETRDWDATLPAFASTANAVALELIANVDEASRQLTACLHDLGPGPHHLVALSRSAVSAARVALAMPDRVASCTLVNGWALAPGGGRAPLSDDAPALGRARVEIYRSLIQCGMPCPTLLVWSIDDPIGDRDAAAVLNEMFVQRQRETEIRYFARAGTDVFRERPAAFNRMVSGFTAHAASRSRLLS